MGISGAIEGSNGIAGDFQTLQLLDAVLRSAVAAARQTSDVTTGVGLP